MSKLRHVRGDEQGALGVDVLALGALVFIALTLVIANAWAVVDAKMAVSAAAREAARSFVEAPDAAAADASGRAAAQNAVQGHGRSGPVDVTFEGTGFERCARVRATVTHEVPVITGVPWISGLTGASISVAATHSELVDAFRGGVDSADSEQGALVGECAP